MLGPRKEQEEMESLAFGRPKCQQGGNSIARACMVLSTPCCAAAGRNPRRLTPLKIAFYLYRVNPVASDLLLWLAAWDFQHSV